MSNFKPLKKMYSLRKLWAEKPFTLIIILAIFFRLLAVLFSKGYAMMDDHYLVIEQAQMWVDDYDDNKWLPAYGATTPSGHSLFYVGIHYLFFSFFEFIGICEPQFKMYLIRLFHAAFSLLIIIFGYKITLHISNKKSALQVALLLSIGWLFPFLSVRNLVEYACIPFFMWGLWYVLKSLSKEKNKTIMFLAGFICGLSISVRFQAILLIAGLVLALIIKKKWNPAIFFSTGTIVSFILFQGVTDYFIWKRPFAELSEYIKYNLNNRYTYFTGNWYNYILLILGLLLPPVSFFLFFGWLKTWKKHLLVFLPALLFLLFHIYFPNRQERFILPILPLIIITGVIGWNEFIATSNYWQKQKKLLFASWAFFWTLNVILLIPLSLTYTKRSYVEAMTYLKNQKITYIVIDDMNHNPSPMIPRFYLVNWKSYYYTSGIYPYYKLAQTKEYLIKHNIKLPNYFIFLEKENLFQRVDSMNMLFPKLVCDTLIEPGFIDRVMHFLNKRNKNPYITIYHRDEK